MSQQEKGKLNFCWTSMHKKNGFLAHFMRILNPCAVWQDSILQTVVCTNQSNRTLMLGYSYWTRQRSLILQLQIGLT